MTGSKDILGGLSFLGFCLVAVVVGLVIGVVGSGLVWLVFNCSSDRRLVGLR